MKHIFSILLVAIILVSCKEETKNTDSLNDSDAIAQVETQDVNYKSFGKEITAKDALPAKRMAVHYASMTVGDSIDAKMIAKVDEVCQAKGCWMKLDLPDGEQVMVKFKDYGFFMPKDISGKEVIINGKAFVNEVPVDEQRHYAEDGGATPEEIAKITEPKKTYSFLADGVLLKAK
ncbi:DUF4920 domain-containing protein [Psychroserpens sp. SPM9]|uniref:DUF4920 domain-containing protein n=1 Tax=Psychroserpens sp. SPM9 TaxID=2975598 RepID=UPI0021A6D4C2|nr:DUF4920 domain-containing protein [Psychroserpens sp. SPM9]MDG5492543.1 DUF4920 domain-containing protein [Psychroserpens sp. SPM9]